MAACTLAVLTPDTATTPNTSGAFTPAAGDTLVVLFSASAVVNETAPTCTSSVAGQTFTRVTFGFYSTSFLISAFISDQPATAVSQTVTCDTPNDQGTGTIIGVYRVSGMTRRGILSVRQFKTNFGAAAVTPSATFDTAALTGNVTLGMFANLTNPAGITFPPNWTESGDVGYASPDHGGEVIFRDSGFTGTLVQWGSNSGNAWGTLMLELDSAAATVAPAVGLALLEGRLPTVTGTSGVEGSTAPGVGAITAVGQIPGEERILNQAGTAGLATIAGLAPTLTRELAIAPTVGLAQMGGQVPGEYRELNQQVGVGLAILGGQLPTVVGEGATEAASTPTAGLATIAGLAPNLETIAVITPQVGSITGIGYAPDLVGETAPSVGVGTLTIVGLEPTLTLEGVVEEIRGYVKTRKRRSRYYGQIPEASDSHVPVVVVEPPPPTITVVAADYQDGGVLTIDTTGTELELGRIETRRAAIARQRREEEELLAILMRAA
jgi:hypothetical protein